MVTVREGVANYFQSRADKAEMKVIAEAQQKIADEVRAGTSKMKGLAEFGDLEVIGGGVLTGRRGVPYFELVTAEVTVNFFPNARYSPFLAKAQEEQS